MIKRSSLYSLLRLILIISVSPCSLYLLFNPTNTIGGAIRRSMERDQFLVPELLLQVQSTADLLSPHYDVESANRPLKQASFEVTKSDDNISQPEREIIDLKLSRSRLYNFILIGVSISGLIISYLLFRNYKHRQNAKNNKLKRLSDRKFLDMERRILASVIETENKERKRFAADLHDGLGPLLSSAKLYLGEILDADRSEQILMVEQTREIIDSAIRNTREISRNIIPITLNEQGLSKSIEDFCRRIERISDLQIFLHGLELDWGKDERLNPGLQVVLFRILTELINNTLRHAEAKNINISVQEKNQTIVLVYTDDGRGFEVDKTLGETKSGMGLTNIKERIKSLHGKIQIGSKKSEGTTIQIEIPI